MSNQKNGSDNKNGLDKDMLKEKFAIAIEFCKKNVRYISAAGLFIVLVIVLVKTAGVGQKNENGMETEAIVAETEAQQDYAKDAYPKINELISNYYTSYANGDVDTLATLADPVSDMEKSYISAFSEYVDAYENISCYTKPGLDADSYIVSVYLEIKFKDVETTAPGLETFYVRTREDGSFYIDNVYGQFNTEMNEFEKDPEISALLDEVAYQEDAIALQNDVQKKYEDAVTSDEKLKNMVETTIPDVITVWAADLEAAAKKAEEEQKAAEEAEKKAAEEEAAKKAEEEKKAAEQAAAVTVYATEKVNVRADASENADIIGQLAAGSATTRLEEREDGWSRIDYNNGTQGYVKSEYLSTEAPGANSDAATEGPAAEDGLAEGTVITIQQSTNIRESMSESSAKVATAFAGEKVTVIMSYAEGWTKVTYGEKTGYIKTELLQ